MSLSAVGPPEMEPTLPTRTASDSEIRHVADLDASLPPDVRDAIAARAWVSTPDMPERFTARLAEMWIAEAGRLVRDEELLGTVRVEHLAKEIGHRLRGRSYVPPNHPRQALGDSEFRIDGEISNVTVNDGATTFIVPSVNDRALVGSSAYPGASHLNPCIWVPVMTEFSGKRSVVWELGPAWVSSARELGSRMERDVLLVQAPSSNGKLRTRTDPHCGSKLKHREKAETATAAAPDPDLVLVPLPVPVDASSIYDCVRAFIQTVKPHRRASEDSLGMWAPPEGVDIEVEHPEFSTDIESYLKAVTSRLASLRESVEKGATVAIVVPTVRGVSNGVEMAVMAAFPGWRLVQRMFAFEEGGKKHRVNGTPLVGDAITIWAGGR